MQNFISTETAILVSLLGQQMPNLYKYIVDYAAIKTNKEPETLTNLHLVSPQQIQAARLHSSTIILYALDTVATAQGALNIINDKLAQLEQQRLTVENALTSLRKKQEEKNKEDDDSEDENDTEE